MAALFFLSVELVLKMPENGLFKALSETIERPHGKLSDGSGLHKALKETTRKDCFIDVGLRKDHKRTI